MKRTQNEFVETLNKRNSGIEIVGTYMNNTTPILARCKSCGHEWEPIPHNLLRGSGCPRCAGNQKKTQKEFISNLQAANPNINVMGEYIRRDKKILVECNHCKGQWEAAPFNLLKGAGCPYCAKEALGNRNRKKQIDFINELSIKNSFVSIIGTYRNSSEPILTKCLVCGWEWKAAPQNLLNGSGCPKCKKYLKTSFPEQAVFYYIKKNYIDAINSYNDIFDDQMEIDVYIPSEKIGVEYDGAFWHSDSKSLIREKRKFSICQENGIRLIRIKERRSELDNNIADKIIYTDGSLESALKRLANEIVMPLDMNIENDAVKIKQQYVGVKNIVETTDSFKKKLYAINPEVEVIGEYINSTLPIKVRCKRCGCEWTVSPNSLLANHGCKKCRKKDAIEKVTKPHESFMEELAQKNDNIQILGKYISGKEKLLVKCNICGREWFAIPNNLLKGNGCIRCSGYRNERKTTEEFKQELYAINPNIEVISEYNTAQSKIIAKCIQCGYEWETTPIRLIYGQTCPKESGRIKRTTDSFKEEMRLINPEIIVLGAYKKSKEPILVRCKKCGCEWNPTPNSLLQKHGCPDCKGNKKKSQQDFISEISAKNNSVLVLGEYQGANTPVRVMCKECSYVWNARPTHLLRGHGCPKCNS